MPEVNRKLVSIRKISEVLPIEGADNIELVKVDGWQCVTKKGEFAPGNLCVYFEIDSFLPIRPEFEFLRKSSYKKMGDKEGFRVKTIRLRGQLSQGLSLHIHSLFRTDRLRDSRSDGLPLPINIESIESYIGYDVTEILGVEKYDPPIPAQLAGVVKGNFPSFIRKTDQERVQNIWDKIKDSKESFEVTIKLDGTSCTYYYNNGEFGVCSRNLELVEDENNTLWKIAKELRIKEILTRHGNNIALQGEIIGEGIQGNPECIKGQRFYLFDIWDIDEQKYLKSYPRTYICNNFDILHVPVICNDFGFAKHNYDTLDDLLNAANGQSLRSEIREGLVFKSNNSDLTFKVISNEYLLKEKG